jgi:hypothetical protein
MSEEKLNDLLKELKALPKPELQKQVQNQMAQDILSFSTKHQKRTRWENKMKKLYASVATAVAVIAISVISYSALMDEDAGLDKSGSQIEETEKLDKEQVTSEDKINDDLDPIDINLPEHQIAIGDVFFHFPDKRNTVFIDRRIENEFTIVDIRDKKTNKLLYRFGETVGNIKEKMVFREIQTKNIKTTIRLQLFLEVDTTNGTITKINKTNIAFDPTPPMIDRQDIYAYSRSDKFPADEVELLSMIQLAKENKDTKDPAKMIEIENINEGFIIGVVKKE